MNGVNHYFVELEKTLNDKIKTKSGFELYAVPEYDHEWNVSVTGKVVAVPSNKNFQNDHVKLGDEIAFSYMVVNNRKFLGNSHIFQSEIDQPYLKQYYNNKGDTLRIIKMPPQLAKNLWVGSCISKKKQLIDGCEGTQSDAEKWLSQFPMSMGKDFVYDNAYEINGKTYWKVSKEQIFAKRLKNKLFSCGEYVICEPILVDLTQQVSILKGIHLAPHTVLSRYMDRAKVVSGGIDLGLQRNDIVSFEQRFVNKYTLFDQNYFLIKDSRINGRWT